MSNRWVISWLVIDYWRWSMSNRSPKILWPIDYSSMTSITHWCNWLLIDDPSITHHLLYYARKTLSCFLVPFFFVCDSFICVRRIFPCIWRSWRSCFTGKRKRAASSIANRRTKFAHLQKMTLEALYKDSKYPSHGVIEEFAKLNNLDAATVKVWFNNKRQRDTGEPSEP